MQKNPIGWVEVPVTDMDRAKAFYQAVFGYKNFEMIPWEDGEMAWFPMDDGYGASGALCSGKDYTPSQDGVMVYFTSPSGDLTADEKKVQQAGGTIVMPRKDIGEFGFMITANDTEGNKIGIHSRT
jgi:predicted enzyme related to lactoylglutathione lyase